MSDGDAQNILAALQRLDAGLGRVEAGLERIEPRLGQVEAGLAQVGAGLGQVETRLGQVETRLGQVETKVEQIEPRLEQVETRLERVEARQDTMRSDIMARIDRLQHKLDQTHDDMIVNFGNTDRVERVARGAVDDARTTAETLRVMQRQIMRLQTDVEQLRGAP